MSATAAPAPRRAPGAPAAGDVPRIVAWELTRRCELRCRHCRGASCDRDYAGELTTDECRSVIDHLAAFVRPMLILTGGEPLMRPDVFDIAAHASARGLTCVLATCGHAFGPGTPARLKAAGIRALSLSFDGPDAASHDAFRGVAGAFDRTLRAAALLRAEGLPFQVNTTLTRLNACRLPEILSFAAGLGAMTLDVFFLVPTGRGGGLRDLELPPDRQEDVLRWIVRESARSPIRLRTTCAPHMARVRRPLAAAEGVAPVEAAERRGHGLSSGCLAGREFVFVSHTGILQPCGFLDVPCGDLRALHWDFGRAYRESAVFAALRRVDDYGGACGRCEYRRACGGCRARAHARAGDYLAEEPSCGYEPRTDRHG